MIARRLVAVALMSALLPGCGLLFAFARGAFASSGGPLTEGTHARGDTSFGGSSREQACGRGGNAPQHVYTFVAPRAALYTFESRTTDYDGVLSVRDPATSSELACNDDTGGTTSSEIVLSLEAGRRVEVVQGGYQGGAGRYELWVEAGTLSGGAAGAAGGALTLGVASVYPAATHDTHANVCGAPQGSLDRTFSFTAPSAAFYGFYSDAPAWLVVDDGQQVVACSRVGPDRRVGLQLKPRHRYSVVVELGAHDEGQHALLVQAMQAADAAWQTPPRPTSALDAGVVGG